eukprot:scaffold1772_cov34-Cyclotella_meneghiniana.AAC.1
MVVTKGTKRKNSTQRRLPSTKSNLFFLGRFNLNAPLLDERRPFEALAFLIASADLEGTNLQGEITVIDYLGSRKDVSRDDGRNSGNSIRANRLNDFETRMNFDDGRKVSRDGSRNSGINFLR